MWVMREEEVAFKSSDLLLSVDEVELFSGQKNRFAIVTYLRGKSCNVDEVELFSGQKNRVATSFMKVKVK